MQRKAIGVVVAGSGEATGARLGKTDRLRAIERIVRLALLLRVGRTELLQQLLRFVRAARDARSGELILVGEGRWRGAAREQRLGDRVVAVAQRRVRGRPAIAAARLVDGRTVMAMKARPLGRKGVVVGDRVRVVGDTSGDDGSLARIVEVQERTTVLRRTADDDDPVERVIVSNAEQLVVVTALADPEPRPRLIDRALVAAYDAGMAPLLCLTKADLAAYKWKVTKGGIQVRSKEEMKEELGRSPDDGDAVIYANIPVMKIEQFEEIRSVAGRDFNRYAEIDDYRRD